MIHDTFALIYTGDQNPLLRELTLSRSVAAVPFGGRYRCIDFVLSNLVNSGIDNVGLIMQKNYHSLMDHLGSGKEWNLNRKHDGLFILPPFMTKDNAGVFRGDIDAIHSVITYIRRSPQKYVLFTGSHTIFNTTFEDMLRQHVETGADITMMYNVDPHFSAEDQNRDLRLIMRGDGRVTEMEWNPYRPRTNARSCEVLILEKKLLEYFSRYGVPTSRICFELSEKLLAETDGQAARVLQHLRNRGFHFMLVNFGGDTCPMMRLSGFSVDYVLLSPEVANFLGNSERSDNAVKSIIGFVNDIGAEPIADGVYNSRQAETLYSFECAYCAGSLAGKYMTERYVRRKSDT